MRDSLIRFSLGKRWEGFGLAMTNHVSEGEFIGVYGPSGSGKTTFLRVFSGLCRIDNGFLEYDTVVWDRGSVFCPPQKRQVGYVFQEYALFPHMSVVQQLRFGLGDKDNAVWLDELIEVLDLGSLLRHKPNQLSGGQQQLVGIARALIANPKVIFADEPTGNLHSEQADQIMEVFQELNQKDGVTIVQVTHSEKNAAYGNRIIRLKDGWLV